MIYDVLLLMLCTFFKGLFALFCHFFKGLSVAKIQNFLLKGKGNGNYFFFNLKGKFFLSLLLFLYFCNIILKIGVPDSRGMLYYEQSRIIKTRKMMKRTTSLFLFHFPYRHNLNPYSVSFEGLPLGESDDFTLFAACNGGGSCQASYIEDALFWSSLL